MSALLAAAPLLAVIVTLVCGFSARTASITGICTTVPLMIFVFPTSGTQLSQTALNWGPVVLEVVLVLAGGILFAEAGRFTGNQEIISQWVTNSLGTGITPVLAIVHGFTPLTESLTGYGIGAALAVPLLLALGLPGKKAAVIGLLGLCAVPWGSMGPGTLIASHLSGVDFDLLGVTTAVFNLVVVAAVGITAALIVASPGRRTITILAALGSAFALWVGVLGSNLLIGTAPAGAVGGLFVLIVHLGIRRLCGMSTRLTPVVGRATAPFVLVLGGMLLATVTFNVTDARGSLSEAVVGSPAFWLFAASALLLAVKRGHVRTAVRESLRTWSRVAPATVLFIALGALMGASGMSEELAHQLGRLGDSYLFFLPMFAALVGYITGSNSGANALASGAQADVARVLGADVPFAVGAHNSAAAAAMMASPARIELATQLARVQSERGYVQRLLLTTLAGIATSMGLMSIFTL